METVLTCFWSFVKDAGRIGDLCLQNASNNDVANVGNVLSNREN
ncbi:hypothetical protein RBWH47_03986 [Rhodopirellula baltica WH47]|uniref:Secreted protein n=1 Tax=Rhodopirellula baltica WH47 TaxID=991778 RepID=F2ATW3_RHOBT|nr:hypothetical protein RBWH47_03986 [Rhodopirellula baltica WH47]